MPCSWTLVLALGIHCFHLGVGHAMVRDQDRSLAKPRLPLGDLSHICLDREEGELVPHPLDCSGYFSCSRIPTLLYCDQGLQFDEERRVCDTPENTICHQTDVRPGQSDASELQWWPHKPRPVFVAVDVSTGESVNPMEKYDPKQIECRHYGAYFLPHPTNCRLYFICAYGHLHRHQCGQGTWWNFEASECQLRDQAVCYAHPREDTEEPAGQVEIVVGNTTPSSGAPVTVCYIVGSGGYTTLQQLLTDPEITEVSTASVPVPLPPRAETTAAVTAALACPSTEQSYMSHPEDCAKYYICIGGMPVLTSCPKGLFWDQKSGYCEMEKNVRCFQK
ncbi:hypothetical protein KR018_000918 [Drosophila ironensis]|nr:hypothetical protein KR018_000918 [Drosophila ironensis]